MCPTFEKDKFRPTEFFQLANGTNLEHLNLSFFKQRQIQTIKICPAYLWDKFRPYKYVPHTASQQTYFIVSRSQSNPILGGGEQIWFGCKESPRVDAASQQTYFIFSGSPSNPVLGGGDQIGFKCKERPLGLMLLRSKLILLSPAPHPIQFQGEVTKYALDVKKDLWG